MSKFAIISLLALALAVLPAAACFGLQPDGELAPGVSTPGGAGSGVGSIGAAASLAVPWAGTALGIFGTLLQGYLRAKHKAKAGEYHAAAKVTFGALDQALDRADLNGDGKVDAEDIRVALAQAQKLYGVKSTVEQILGEIKK